MKSLNNQDTVRHALHTALFENWAIKKDKAGKLI